MTRIDSTIGRQEERFNSIYSDYVLKENAYIRENALCNGPASAAGVSCSDYGFVRQTIAGGTDPQRNVLFHRSDYSSGGPPLKFDKEEGKKYMTPEQRRILNRGTSMQGLETRSFEENIKLIEEPFFAEYRSIPNRVATQFQGFMPLEGMNQSTRTQSLYEVEKRFEDTKNLGYSAYSYGSYGLYK